jgi:hypothetical protein
MWCHDPLLQTLAELGYCAVRLPRTGINPLQLIVEGRRSFHPFGDLATILSPGENPLPSITTDKSVTLRTTRSGRLKLGLGLALLNGFVSAFGGSPVGLDALYSRATSLSFDFGGVTHRRVDLAHLDAFLTTADIQISGQTTEELLDASNLYAVIATLESKTFSVTPTGDSVHNAHLSIDALKDVVGTKLTVASVEKDSGEMTYAGTVPLVFAFQAVRLVYEDGMFKRLKLVTPSSGRMLTGAMPDTTPDYLQSVGPFLTLLD